MPAKKKIAEEGPQPQEARESYDVTIHGSLDVLGEARADARHQRSSILEKVHELWEFLFEGRPELPEPGISVCEEPEGSGLLTGIHQRIVSATNEVAEEAASLAHISDLLQALLDRLGSSSDTEAEGP